MATAYYTDTRKKRYTVAMHLQHDAGFYHWNDCELVTFGKRVITDDRHARDVWSHTREYPRDTHRTLFVSVATGGTGYHLWAGGSVDGVLYVPADRWGITSEANFRESVAALLADYSAWASGDVWGVIVTDEVGDTVEVVWGFIGEDYAADAAADEYSLWNCGQTIAPAAIERVHA